MQLFKRAISLILALVLLLGNMPAVYAAETETIPETEAVETEVIETTAEVIPEETESPAEATTVVMEETQPTTVSAVEITSTETVPEETIEETLPEETVVETVPEEAEEETTPEETEGGFVFTGLPEGYELGILDKYHRRSILQEGAVAQLKAQTPGGDYVADEILVFAEDEAEAALFAAVFGGELRSFSGKMAVIGLTEMTVLEAVEASVSDEILLPAASANHITRIESFAESGLATASVQAAMAGPGDAAPVEKDWNYWINVVGIDDEYLQDPGDEYYQWWHDMLDTYAAWGVTMGRSSIYAAYITDGEIIISNSFKDTEGKYYVQSASGPNSGHDGYRIGNSAIETMVGTIGNGKDGAGIAPNCYVNVYYSRSPEDYSYATAAGITECILDAADNSVNRVILVDELLYDYNAALDAAVQYAIEEKKKPVIANVGDLYGNALTYPAAIDGVIGVACVDRDGGRYIESNYGSHVDISAPAWESDDAAAVVTGAALLYLSVYPETTPAQLEKALEAACTKLSDSGMGAGMLNLAKLFGGKPTAPKYIIADGVGFQELDPKGTIPCESFIVFQTSEGAADDNGILLVTDDGKTPAVKDGKIVSGFTVMGSDGSYILDLADYAGKTVTLKAAWVSGTGVMGNAVSVKLKVAASTNIASIELSGPGVTPETGNFSTAALSGKSYTYAATLIPKTYTTMDGEKITAAVTDQRVIWTIENKSADLTSAKVDKNGKLTLPRGKAGTVVLCAAAVADPNAKAYLQVTVENLEPVRTVLLNDIAYDEASDFGYISVKQLLDAKGNDLSDYLMVFDVQWTSSNTKVAEIRPIDDMPGYAEIIRKGPGKVKFTATILDGGNAKATSANFTMKQKVEEIQLDMETYYVEPGGSVTPKATVLPRNATDKTLTWKFVGTPPSSSFHIDPQNGKISIDKHAAYNSGAYVAAYSNDGNAYKKFMVYVKPKTQKLEVKLNVAPHIETEYSPKYDKNGNVTEVTLFTVSPPGATCDMTYLSLDILCTSTVNGTEYETGKLCSSSNQDVVLAGFGTLFASGKPGIAKVTVRSADGAKKHTVTVKVVTPPSSITVCSSMPTAEDDSRYTYMAVGASATNTVRFGDAYGKPTNSKVTWSYSLKIYCSGSPEDKAEASNYYYDVQDLITFKNGKLTTKKELGTYVKKLKELGARIEYTVIATMDGARGELTYIIAPATTTIYPEETTYTIDTGNYDNETPIEIIILTDSKAWTPTVTSSNPAAAGAESYYWYGQDPETKLERLSYHVWIPEPVKKATNVTLTFKVPDGTNKSCKVTLKLMPKFEIRYPWNDVDGEYYLAAGYTAALKAGFGTGTEKNVNWEVSDVFYEGSAQEAYFDKKAADLTGEITLDNKGNLKLSADAEKMLKGLYESNSRSNTRMYVNVTARTADGSSKHTMKICLVPPVEKLYAEAITIDTSEYVGTDYSETIGFGKHIITGITLTSSNPKLVSVEQAGITFMGEFYMAKIKLHIHDAVTRTTKVTITVKTVDGTNKTCKFVVTLLP